MSFCSECNNLQDPGDGSSKSLKSSLHDLLASAQGGCQTCILLRDGIVGSVPDLQTLEVDVIDIDIRLQRSLGRPAGAKALFVHLRFKDGSPDSGNPLYDRSRAVTIEFFSLAAISVLLLTAQDHPCPWGYIPILRSRPSGYTASAESFSKAEKWLQHCTEGHSLCRAATVVRPLPTRVLSVDPHTIFNPGFYEAGVRLYETRGESDRYVCLSHCWGNLGSHAIRTTRTSLQSHKQGIPWSSLPRTFQDAISFTRKLGISYLWIDSLCIVQDDHLDWDRESAKMAEVYQGSFITLAATKSKDNNGGFYGLNPVKELTGFMDGRPYRIYATRLIRHWDYKGSGVGIFPLLDRGWVFQERLLPPRVLHFSLQELFWECLEETQCECSRIVEHNTSKANQPKIAHLFSTWEGPITPALERLIVVRWHKIVFEYSKLALSVQSDRLRAVAGLAKQIRINKLPFWPNDRYLAGLWESSFVDDLLWYTSTTSRPTKWQAPSWSWASVIGPVYYVDTESAYQAPLPEGKAVAHSDVLSMQCTPAGVDPVGEVSAGRMVVSGPLMAGRVSLSDDGISYDVEISGENAHSFHLDSFFNESEQNRLKESNIIYCLRLASNELAEYSLVLRCVDSAQHVYERIGLVENYSSLGWERSHEWRRDLFSLLGLDGGVGQWSAVNWYDGVHAKSTIAVV